jgi:hypothetical protein
MTNEARTPWVQKCIELTDKEGAKRFKKYCT